MKLKLLLNILAIALFAHIGVVHSSEQSERAEVKALAKAAYAAGDLASLIRQHAEYSDFLKQRTSSGATKMLLFFDGIAELTRDFDAEQLQSNIAKTLQWSESARNEPLPYIFHANSLIEYAGYVRGRGYANTVPPQAWKTYSDYVNRATKFLVDNEKVASRSTSWHVSLINALRNSGASSDAVMRLFESGIAANPTDYRLYKITLEYFLPKWHGTPQAVDTFIRGAATVAPSEYGAEMYARLYSGAEQDQFGRVLYSDSLIDWGKMKGGLALWNKRFPTVWNKNIFAYHACIAGDKALAKELLSEIGTIPEGTIWQPNAQSTFSTCSKWALDPAAEPLEPLRRPRTDARLKESDKNLENAA
jgi:hypothetical protein